MVIANIGKNNEKYNQNLKFEFMLRNLILMTPFGCYLKLKKYGYAPYNRIKNVG